MPEDHGPATWSKKALVREVIALRRLLRDQMAAAPGTGDEVVVEGVVSRRTGRPLVHMRSGEATWQFDTTQAREHAMAVLERAVEAERDAATLAFLRSTARDDESEEERDAFAGGFLAAMREHRDQVTHRVVVEPVREPNAREPVEEKS